MARKKKNLDFSFVTEDSMLIFQRIIVDLKKETGSWLDAVVSYFEDHSMEVEDVVPLMSEALKSLIFDEGIINKTIKNTDIRLPI